MGRGRLARIAAERGALAEPAQADNAIIHHDGAGGGDIDAKGGGNFDHMVASIQHFRR